MKRVLEKAALLSLSLILVSTYSISAVLPMMRTYYQGFSDAQVDLLVSVPSFGILLVSLLNAFFADRMKEKPMVIAGLLLASVLGTAPMFCGNYYFVLVTRFLTGLSVGMVNVKAISVISERYEGHECSVLLGYRASAESLGNSIMTFAAGVLLLAGWNRVFAIYLFALLILALYLSVFGRETSSRSEKGSTVSSPAGRMPRRSLVISLLNLGLGFLAIGGNTALTLRVSVIVLERGFGSASAASVILGIIQASGIAAGILYGATQKLLGRRLLKTVLFVSAAGTAGIVFAPNIAVLALFSLIFSFCNVGIVTTAFRNIPEFLPKEDVDRATSYVLVGCNLGAFTFPFIVSLISNFSGRAETPLILYTAVMVLTGCILTVRTQILKREAF